MKRLAARAARGWMRIAPQFLPFADAACTELPLPRLLRLSLFQVSVGIAAALLIGTLNRVMIVELKVPAWLVAVMVALPLLFAPFRALVGFRSDTYRSALGWRRVPFIWMGTMLQFGGLAIMPFSLLILSGDTHGPVIVGQVGAALAFLLVGAGFHTTQTTGLALATDLAPVELRPRVVALMYVMLLFGVALSSLTFGWLLTHFSELRLIQVVQGAGLVTMLLNGIALWKQEARRPVDRGAARPKFRDSWQAYAGSNRALRFLLAVGLGSAAFSMQDILLEPYGGQILGLSVSATTLLTAIIAFGALCAFTLAARLLARGADPYRIAAAGVTVGLGAFACIILSAPFESPLLYRCGSALIGFSGGLFGVGTLIAAMGIDSSVDNGLALGAWGAVQACAAGTAIAISGALRDLFSTLAAHGALGPALTGPAVGYGCVYHIEVVMLFATLIAIGPLVRPTRGSLVSAGYRLAGASGSHQ
ncbi:MAG: PucC family protein [Proteobacteria bacterium]|nr:PucC family protein [Pseudomonadota bacterium]